jgi:hypothetical protein
MWRWGHVEVSPCRPPFRRVDAPEAGSRMAMQSQKTRTRKGSFRVLGRSRQLHVWQQAQRRSRLVSRHQRQRETSFASVPNRLIAELLITPC